MSDDGFTTGPRRLDHHARTQPTWPWLVFRDTRGHGLDWAWSSFRQIADQVARSQAVVAGTGPGPVVIDDRLTPENIVARLVLEVARVPASPRPNVDTPFEIATLRSRLRRGSWASMDLDARIEDRPRADRVSADDDIDTLLSTAGRLPRRPVALASGRLGEPGVDRLLAWSLDAGATIALEPDAELADSAVGWVRPHVAAVPAKALDDVRAKVAGQKPRWRRLRVIGTAEDGIFALLNPNRRDSPPDG